MLRYCRELSKKGRACCSFIKQVTQNCPFLLARRRENDTGLEAPADRNVPGRNAIKTTSFHGENVNNLQIRLGDDTPLTANCRKISCARMQKDFSVGAANHRAPSSIRRGSAHFSSSLVSTPLFRSVRAVMKASQLRRLSLLLVVCLLAVAATRAPLSARAQEDDDDSEEAELDIDLDAPDESDEEMDEKDVVVLTKENFKDVVLTARFALVRLSTRASRLPSYFVHGISSCFRRPGDHHLRDVHVPRRWSSTLHGASIARCDDAPTHRISPHPHPTLSNKAVFVARGVMGGWGRM